MRCRMIKYFLAIAKISDNNFVNHILYLLPIQKFYCQWNAESVIGLLQAPSGLSTSYIQSMNPNCIPVRCMKSMSVHLCVYNITTCIDGTNEILFSLSPSNYGRLIHCTSHYINNSPISTLRLSSVLVISYPTCNVGRRIVKKIATFVMQLFVYLLGSVIHTKAFLHYLCWCQKIKIPVGTLVSSLVL